MRGYFEYILYGTEEELNKALKLVEDISNGEVTNEILTQKYAKSLLSFNNGISKHLYSKDNSTHILCFGMKNSGDINKISFLFEEMPHILSNTFKELKLEGTGYLIDNPPYEEFISERGQVTYTIKYKPMLISISEWDVDISNKEAEFECPSCEEILTCDLSDIDEYTCNILTKCDCCDIPIQCNLDFYVSELFDEE